MPPRFGTRCCCCAAAAPSNTRLAKYQRAEAGGTRKKMVQADEEPAGCGRAERADAEVSAAIRSLHDAGVPRDHGAAGSEDRRDASQSDDDDGEKVRQGPEENEQPMVRRKRFAHNVAALMMHKWQPTHPRVQRQSLRARPSQLPPMCPVRLWEAHLATLRATHCPACANPNNAQSIRRQMDANKQDAGAHAKTCQNTPISPATHFRPTTSNLRLQQQPAPPHDRPVTR